MNRIIDVQPERGEPRAARAGGDATLATESFGVPGDPALLLLAGATWSMDWWHPDLCRLLAAEGLYVVRYDQRDTGASSTSPAGEPGYDALDLAADVLAVLDTHGIGRAALMGLSMGGGLAQRVAAATPSRVSSLVLLATGPAAEVGRDLPPPAPEILATFTDDGVAPDWSDRAAVVDHVVAAERPYAGPGMFDEAGVRGAAGISFDRSADPSAAESNHGLVAAGDAPAVDLAAITAPTLVVHGSADPMFALEHGQALNEVLPSTGPVLVLEGVGHQTPPRATWPVVVAAVAAHVRGATQDPTA